MIYKSRTKNNTFHIIINILYRYINITVNSYVVGLCTQGEQLGVIQLIHGVHGIVISRDHTVHDSHNFQQNMHFQSPGVL